MNVQDPRLKRLTRTDLYEAVWSEPLIKLAAKYGISDRGLAKVCNKYNIPLPGVGYWAKVHAGRKVIRVPLPPLKLHNPEQVVFICKQPKNTDVKYSDEVCARVLFEQDPQNIIAIKDGDEFRHPFTLKIEKILSSRIDNRGMVKGKRGELHCLRVALASVKRALSIFDAFFEALSARNVMIQMTPEYQLHAKILDENFVIGLHEKVDLELEPTARFNCLKLSPNCSVIFELKSLITSFKASIKAFELFLTRLSQKTSSDFLRLSIRSLESCRASLICPSKVDSSLPTNAFFISSNKLARLLAVAPWYPMLLIFVAPKATSRNLMVNAQKIPVAETQNAIFGTQGLADLDKVDASFKNQVMNCANTIICHRLNDKESSESITNWIGTQDAFSVSAQYNPNQTDAGVGTIGHTKEFIVHPDSIKQGLRTGEAYCISKVKGFGWEKVKVIY